MSYNVATDDSYRKKIALNFGSIRSHIKEIALDRGFRNKAGGVHINRLAREGHLSTNTLYFIFNKADSYRAIDLVTLAKLCKVLKAQPGELFSFVPGLTSDALGINTDLFASLEGTR
jgi:DNA-binding Xre family transcriptional regulator